jgi:flagellar biosynthesis regulator FlaF
MSEKGSVFQKGGGGTNFEQSIQTAFITGLVIAGSAPCLPANEIVEVSFQNTSRGYETDDLLIIAKSGLGEHRLLMQIKHDVSFTENSETFKEVLQAFWKDYNNTVIFDKTKDKLIVVKGGLTKDERNHFKSIFNWANSHATEADFINEVNRIKGKKERLEIIRNILKEANGNVALTDKEIWEFTKCMDVLEYDLLQSGSVDQAYFLNLIKLSKSRASTLSEKEIWDGLSAIAATFNKDGGNITTETIRQMDICKNFSAENLIPHFNAIEKLKSDSSAIVNPLKDTIGEVHLKRSVITDNIVQSISTFPITIVTGKPGVGKSAQVKNLLQNELATSGVFVFRADQFNLPHIANVFSNQGIDMSIRDIFSCISLIPDKILYLDSFEKLLEADPECAFKQLMGILAEYPDIKLIVSSRKYAIDLIIQKFGLSKEKIGVVEIPLLTDEEFGVVSEKYPRLKNVLDNKKIRPLLQSPKYLDFAVKALHKSGDDYADIELADFKNRLWNILVVDEANEKNGLPIKRENAFMEIAVKRAKEMKLFTQPVTADAEATALLVKDEMLVQEPLNRRYTPAHDILEDWALIKHISSVYEDAANVDDFFTKIGKEPAIRRALRLWIEELLAENRTKVVTFVREVLSSKSLERYWTDEILTAIFRSQVSEAFFIGFEKDLLAENAKLLIRCLHIIKTCCKENNDKVNLLLPVGSGWREMLMFIDKHIDQLAANRFNIISYLSDWHSRQMFQLNEIDHYELTSAKSAVLHYINEIESGLAFWQKREIEGRKKDLIAILFDLASIAKDEIKKLVERSFANEENNSQQHRSLDKTVIKKCLSGLGNYELIKELPELIVESAWKEWKLRPIEPPPPGSISAMIGDNSLNNDKCWGIEDKHEFFPSGVYKTPLYNLLQYHPLKGLEFLVQFINYSVAFYVQAKCQYKHQLEELEFELPDGTKKKLWGAGELWVAYRGINGTHYLLESLLMSFEKFLLGMAARKTETSRANLKFVYDYVFGNTNNVAPLGVLASVAMAYPTEVDESILPLLKVRAFYEWDLNRALQEYSAMALADQKIPFTQEEQWKANQLPHRKKFMRGLRDFILDYQFNIRKHNKEIHQVFDQLKKDIKEKDVVWKKTITEIDIRNHKLGEYDEKLGGFPIAPQYDKDVLGFMDSGKEVFESDNKAMNYSSQLQKAFEGKESISYLDWQACQKEYKSNENLNILFDRPVTLAVIGLRDIVGQLSEEEKVWCINTILETAAIIIQDTSSRNFGLTINYVLMEKELALSSFHLPLNFLKAAAAAEEEEEERNEVVLIMVHMLIAPFSEHEVDKITKYIREVFSSHYLKETKTIWFSVVQYAGYRKANPYFHNGHDNNRLQLEKEKEHHYIEEQIKKDNAVFDLCTVTLDSHSGYLLTRALLIIPCATNDVQLKEFIRHFVLLLVEDQQQEEDYSYRTRKEGKQIGFQEVLEIKFYLAELLIVAYPSFSKLILDIILDECDKTIADADTYRHQDDLFKFAADVLKFSVAKLDDIVANTSDDTIKNIAINHFWGVWEYLSGKIKKSRSGYFVQQLLLDTGWKEQATDWQPLHGKKEIYRQMITDFGASNVQSILNFFSTIGEKTFLPEGLSWLVELIKKEPLQSIALMSIAAERLVKRLFYNHISEIKKNKRLIDDFVWLLDKMIELGSSEAYLFRENVITYKSTSV